MKIAVYTIALNESLHCERWVNSVRDADYLIVLDTGSTDDTVQKLRELRVTVYQQLITPWRFDVARNAALALVPDDADICISLDMDEFMEDGWRSRLESAWGPKTTRIGYTYVFDYQPGLGSQRGFYVDKIHARHGYEWRRPVHENIFPVPGQSEVYGNDPLIVMNQIQDRSKPTRNNYLKLMEIAHEEDPSDSQIAFWYGRDLMHANHRDKAKKVLEHYLNLPNSNWTSERSQASIYLSQLDPDNAWKHLLKSISDAPKRKEAWLAACEHAFSKQSWNDCLWAALNGIPCNREGSYLDLNSAYGSKLYDLGSIAAYYLGWKEKALELVDKAIELNPHDDRLKNNRKFMV
jgi:glycosyltransferase involved in cell wall biosynthesis